VDHLPPGVPRCACAPQRPGCGMATKAARTVSVTCGHAACRRRPRTPGASAAAGLWPRQHELGANGVWRLHLGSPWQWAGTLASPAASSALWSSDRDRDVGHSTSAWSRRRERRPALERSKNPQRGWRLRLLGLSSPARTTTRSRVHYGLQLPYFHLLLPAACAAAVLRDAATRPESAADAAQLRLLRLGQSAIRRADAGVHDVRLRL